MPPEPDLDLDALTVEELLRRRPEAARVFLRHRMACVGCAMSPFDRLPEAAASYRLPVDGFLEEIRRALGLSDGGPRLEVRLRGPEARHGSGGFSQSRTESPAGSAGGRSREERS